MSEANRENLPAIGGRRPMAPSGAGALEKPWVWARPCINADEEEGRGEGLSLRDLLSVIFRHPWKILIIFFLVAGATIFSLMVMPQAYESEARVYVRSDRTGLTVDPTAENKSILKGGPSIPAEARTEMGIIQSAALLEQVVDKMGVQRVLGLSDEAMARLLHPTQPDLAKMTFTERTRYKIGQSMQGMLRALHLAKPPMTPRQQAVGALQKGLLVEPAADRSSILKVTLAASSPAIAQEALNNLLAAYLQKHIAIHGVLVSPEFFRQRSEEIKVELIKKENELDEMRKRLNITSLENQKAMLLKQYESFDTAMKTSSAQAGAIRARIDLMEKARREGKGTGQTQFQQFASNPVHERLRNQLIDLRLREADLASRFTPQAPVLIDVRSQIANLEKMLSGEKSGRSTLGPALGTGVSDQVELAKAEFEAENARQSILIHELDNLRKELDRLDENGRELQRREREVTLLDSEYRQYVNSMQISRISNDLDRDKVANVSIVQAATLPTLPIKSPRKIMALAIFGLLMGLGAGVGWVFVINFFDHSIKSNEEVEQWLGLPVLMTIPHTRHHRPLLREEIA